MTTRDGSIANKIEILVLNAEHRMTAREIAKAIFGRAGQRQVDTVYMTLSRLVDAGVLDKLEATYGAPGTR